MKRNKKSQHEILGFVLIVLIVSIIGVIFLSLYIAKGKNTKQTSVEISNLLEASMYYTTDCAIGSFPKYQELQDLIKKCYDNPSERCISRDNCETSAGTSSFDMTFTVSPRQGPWGHQKPDGNALEPLFISSVKEGEEISISNINGKITFSKGYYAYTDCNNNPGNPRLGFYDDNKNLIEEHLLTELENGIAVPSGATKAYSYSREKPQDRNLYNDNAGTCTFTLNLKQSEVSNSITSSSFTLNSRQGPWEHVLLGKTAEEPLLVSGVREGETITIKDIEGIVDFQAGNVIDCRNGPIKGSGFVLGGFYDDDKNLIQEYELREFENGIIVPSSATKLYAYAKQYGWTPTHDNYRDNTGTCTFTFTTSESKPASECKLMDERGVCKSLEDNIKYILSKSIVVGEDAPIKAYKLYIYFTTETKLDSEADVLFVENGIFKNCTSIVGGDHEIPIGSFTSGSLNVELETCNS